MKTQLFEEIRKKEKKMSSEQEAVLFYAAQTGCTESHNQLLFNHARFAFFEAKKYMNQLHEDDLIQVSLIGLSEAIKKFDPQKKVKFISFAVWYIKKEMTAHIEKNLNLIRLPATLTEGISYASSFSFDAVEESLFDSIFSIQINQDYNDLEKEKKEKTNYINNILAPLKPLEKEVILLRITTDLTFAEIGKKVKKTPERCRQLFSCGCKKLEKNWTKEELIQLFF